jgi:hypothetical protein
MPARMMLVSLAFRSVTMSIHVLIFKSVSMVRVSVCLVCQSRSMNPFASKKAGEWEKGQCGTEGVVRANAVKSAENG